MPSLLDDTRELFDVLCTPSPQPDEQPDLFLQASDYMWKNRQSFPVTARLRVYALYKQGTVGDAPATGPPVWASVVDQAKYKQWAALRGTAVESARCSYVFAADELTQAAWRSPGEASVPLPDAPCGGETPDRSLRERIRALEAEVSRLTETSMRTPPLATASPSPTAMWWTRAPRTEGRFSPFGRGERWRARAARAPAHSSG